MIEFIQKIKQVFRRRQLERDLEDELAFHLAMRGEGARRRFGNVELVKEDLRDLWTFRAIENFWRDLRYAGRMLRRSPGFTLVAVLSLAIGIGGNTAIFSVVDAILLRSLPVKDPGQLRVVLWTGEQGSPFRSVSGYVTRNRSGIRVHSSFSYPIYEQFVAQVPQFSDLIGFAGSDVTVIAGAASHYADMEYVTGNFFTGLGLTALAGRTLTPGDDRAGAPPIAVISYRYWERRLGLEPEAVGRRIFVNGRAVTIVGIAPKAFLGVRPGHAPDLFVPISLAPLFGDTWYEFSKASKAWVQVMGRLRPGVNDEQAMAGVGAIMQRARLTGEEQGKGKDGPWRPVLENGAGGIQVLRDDAFAPLMILSSVVGLVLLTACANLANLLLARGVARRREIAVRLSIGAGRWRLVRQLLTESILLAGLGAGIGLATAPPLTRLVLNLVGSRKAAAIDAHVDWRTILFSAAAAFVTALLFGLAPALRTTRLDLTPSLKEGSAGASGSSPRLGVSRFLIASQVALSMLLLAGAGLFVRTLVTLSSIDPGFQTERLLLFDVDGSRSGYQGEKLIGLYERVQERVAILPGVESATLSNYALISHNMSSTDGIEIPEYKARSGRSAPSYLLVIGNRFLKTMGIPLIAGRDLDNRDGPKSPKVALVNERFARDYFGGRSAVGKTFSLGEGDRGWIEIVGVCKDTKYDNLKNEVPPTVYLPYTQDSGLGIGMTFELRTAMPPMAIAGAVQRAVASIDRNVPVAEMRTQEEQIRETLGPERMFAEVVSSFGVIAALLAAIGLYGVMAYAVTRRTGEIGIRLALGAGRGDVEWMVLRESLWMVAAGLVVGIPAALGLTKYVQASLYGIKANDPVSFVAAGILMTAVAGVAAWIPARRAARVDPMRALRSE